MLTNALKIVINQDVTGIVGDPSYTSFSGGGTDVYFYAHEVDDVIIVPYRMITEHKNMFSQPFLRDSLIVETVPAAVSGGVISGATQITINIKHAHVGTQTRIEQVINSRYAKIYYKYLDDDTAFKNYVIDPSYTRTYKFGHKAARIITQIIGYETADYVRLTEDDYSGPV